jgi:hypothetical protein
MSSRTATMPTSLPIKGIAAMVSADVFNLDDPALTTPDGFREGFNPSWDPVTAPALPPHL